MPSRQTWIKIVIFMTIFTLFILFVLFLGMYINARKYHKCGASRLTVMHQPRLPEVPVTALDGVGTVNLRPFAKIVHMVQIPWEKTKDQKLKIDENDFDHAWYERAVAAVPLGWKVRLWTYTKLKTLVTERYGLELWDYVWRRSSRPVQAVDFLRILVVYEFGGVSLQYRGDLKKTENMDHFFTPSAGKTTRVFYEYRVSNAHCLLRGREQPIRNGIPEVPDRIHFQVFSGCKHAYFLAYIIDLSLRNLALYDAKTDYDILYIGGNDMISEAYEQYIKAGSSDLELIGRKEFDENVKIHGQNSWMLNSYKLINTPR
jgi:hypothetical protein